MRPVDFHTNVARLPEAERALRQGERPAVQQTFAAEVARSISERERRVERRNDIAAVHLDPRQQQQQSKEQQPQDKEEDAKNGGKSKRRRRLDIRI